MKKVNVKIDARACSVSACLESKLWIGVRDQEQSHFHSESKARLTCCKVTILRTTAHDETEDNISKEEEIKLSLF